jgi:hypothetical protein
MVNSKSLLLVLAFGVVTLQCWAVDNDAAWSNLKHVTRAGFYNFVSRTGQHYAGKITKVTDSSVVITEGYGKGAPVELLRPDLTEVSDGAGGLLYSGRNSWAEVASLAGTTMSGFDVGKGSFLVVTKSGKQLLARTIKVTASDVTLTQRSRKETILKAEVARVEYVRAAPWPERVEWSYQELGPLAIFDPGYWPHMLHLSGKISVPIYDASVPENDTPRGEVR